MGEDILARLPGGLSRLGRDSGLGTRDPGLAVEQRRATRYTDPGSRTQWTRDVHPVMHRNDRDSRLVLASASPRRAELLRAAGIPFDVVVSDVDETQSVGETPDAYVERLAIAKAVAVADRGEARPVLGADTTVVVDGAVLGKPIDTADARRMLLLLSGRTHIVLTGVALVAPRSGVAENRRRLVRVCATQVTFAPLTE